MRLLRVATLTGIILVCSAHVGSPDAWFEGNAGPYHITVQVVTPGVVPGVATVYARVDGEGVEQVTVQANRFDALAGAPPPEIAAPVRDDPGMYSVPLWTMAGGSNSVVVSVRGSLGEGKVVIPVVIVANRRLELDPKLGAGLGAIGLFLLVGLVTIIGAAVRESVLLPGEAPDASRRWKARTAMAGSTAVLALAIFGGSRWWNSEDARFTSSLYKPLTSSSRVESSEGQQMLELKISDSSWIMRNDSTWLRTHRSSRWRPLIPDHGKLIHVFMIREPDLSAFAHLHPSTLDSIDFRSSLPPLPAGRYRVYGDIVHESGFNETLTSTVDLRDAVKNPARATDADDAFLVSRAAPKGNRAKLEDGSLMLLAGDGEAFVEGREASLRFSVVGANGKPIALEPYIGMAGHAVITRDDGEVFVHLHPSGTFSMASQMAITMRQPGDSISGRLGQRIKASESMRSTASLPADNTVGFPYAFPKPGNYHMWVQVKHAGRVLTGAFAFTVEAANP